MQIVCSVCLVLDLGGFSFVWILHKHLTLKMSNAEFISICSLFSHDNDIQNQDRILRTMFLVDVRSKKGE